MQDQLYRFIKASEYKPEKRGWYNAVNGTDRLPCTMFFNGSFWHDDDGFLISLDRLSLYQVLAPVPPADQDKMRELELFKYKLPAQSEDGWRYDYDFINDLTQAVRGNQYSEGVDMETVEAVLLELHNRAMSLLSSTSDGWIRVEDGLPENNYISVWSVVGSTGEVLLAKVFEIKNNLNAYTHWRPTFKPLPPSPNQTIKK